jgi:hypothetical protein
VINRLQEWAAVLDLRACQSNLPFLYSRLPHRWRIMRASAVINQKTLRSTRSKRASGSDRAKSKPNGGTDFSRPHPQGAVARY